MNPVAVGFERTLGYKSIFDIDILYHVLCV